MNVSMSGEMLDRVVRLLEDDVRLRTVAEHCAWAAAGYRVPVPAGQELAVIEARLAELEAHCQSYARSLGHLHRRLDRANASAM